MNTTYARQHKAKKPAALLLALLLLLPGAIALAQAPTDPIENTETTEVIEVTEVPSITDPTEAPEPPAPTEPPAPDPAETIDPVLPTEPEAPTPTEEEPPSDPLPPVLAQIAQEGFAYITTTGADLFATQVRARADRLGTAGGTLLASWYIMDEDTYALYVECIAEDGTPISGYIDPDTAALLDTAQALLTIANDAAIAWPLPTAIFIPAQETGPDPLETPAYTQDEITEIAREILGGTEAAETTDYTDNTETTEDTQSTDETAPFTETEPDALPAYYTARAQDTGTVYAFTDYTGTERYRVHGTLGEQAGFFEADASGARQQDTPLDPAADPYFQARTPDPADIPAFYVSAADSQQPQTEA